MNLSARVRAIKPSPTLSVAARAAKLKAEGKDIIGLGTGEPDFDTPQHIKEAAIAAINQGFTKYTAVGGTAGLRQAVIAKFRRENQLEYNARQILVSCGGKQSLFNPILAVIDPGDEVIVPQPCFVAYTAEVTLAGGIPVTIATHVANNFQVTREEIEARLTPRTKAIIAVHMGGHPADLDALTEITRKHNLRLVEDSSHAHGSEGRGRRVGALGDIGTFSFQQSKLMTSGEGGILLTNYADLEKVACSVHECGRMPGEWR